MATTKFLDLTGLTKYNEKIKAYADSKASSAASGVSVTATTTGSGNAVTSVTASGKTITVTKGTTFLTSHQDISGKADKNIISTNNTYTSSNTVESAINAVVTSVNNHTASKSNPHSVTKAQVGLGNVTNESKATMFTSAALTGTPTAPTAASGTNTTQIATTAFVQSALGTATSQALVFMGTVPTTGLDTSTNLPLNPKVGDTYVIGTAGTYASQTCEVGDTVICTKALDETPATWLVVQKNIDGAVTTTNTLTANTVMLGNGNKAIKNLANGSNGQFLKLVNGTPTWAADNNTTYAAGTGISLSGTTFSNSGVRSVTGSNATLTVNTGGTSSTITINNVAKATEADSAELAAVATSIQPSVSTANSLLLGAEDTNGNYVVSTLLTPSSGVYSMTVSKATSATSATSATTASKVTNALTVKDYSGTTAYTYNGSSAVTISAITESEITALFS
jgi:hypothetical protein